MSVVQSKTEPRDIVNAYVAAYNARDAKALRRLIAPDARMGSPDAIASGEEAVGNCERDVWAEDPEVRISVIEQLAAEDMVAQTQRITGVEYDYISLAAYRVSEGRIVEVIIST